MDRINSEVKNLLDKLYNLKSKESILIAQLAMDQKNANDIKDTASENKNNLSESINTLKQEEVLLKDEGELLKEALNNVNRSSFSVVLNKIGVKFNVGDVLEDVESNLPSTVRRIKSDKETAIEKLSQVEKELNDTITLIADLDLRMDEALSNQSKLSDYVDLALKNNINVTREALINLLSKFNLDDDEQREAAKLLMFPEDALFAYNEAILSGKKFGKSFSDVFAEAKSIELVPEITKDMEDAPEASPIVLDEEVISPIILDEAVDEIVVPIELDKTVVEQIVMPQVVKEEKNVKYVLEDNGFNYENFTNTDVAFIEQHMDIELIEKNVKLMKDMGLNIDVFVDNIELFVDDELETKLNMLIEIGKVPFDIYLNPNILVKYDAAELKSSIDTLKESGLDPKKVPLMAY